jgi:hypothetical protein
MEGMVGEMAGQAALNIANLDAQDFWVITALLAAAVVGLFYLTFRDLRRARLIEDTPTAKVRSAPQGYVELEGWARRMEGAPVYAPLTGAPCVWYRYEVEQHASDGKRSYWRTVESGVSEAIFHLQDDTGLCIVDPDGADVRPSVHHVWHGSTPRPPHGPGHGGLSVFGLNIGALFGGGNYRYSESRIEANDPLYALGLFAATGGDDAGASFSADMSDLLSRWKRDPAMLLREFDRDGDGRIDMNEWEEARKTAERAILQQRGATPPQPAACVLRKPGVGGQPFILATTPQRELANRYRLSAFLSMLGFLLTGAGLTWLVVARFGA